MTKVQFLDKLYNQIVWDLVVSVDLLVSDSSRRTDLGDLQPALDVVDYFRFNPTFSHCRMMLDLLSAYLRRFPDFREVLDDCSKLSECFHANILIFNHYVNS